MLICIFFFLSAIYISLRWWDHFASFNFAEMNIFFSFWFVYLCCVLVRVQ